MFGLKKKSWINPPRAKAEADPWDPWTCGRGGESEYSINIKSTIISVLGIRKERSEQQGDEPWHSKRIAKLTGKDARRG